MNLWTDITMEQKSLDICKSLFLKSKYSYRRLKKLEPKERKIFTKSDLSWNQIKVALAYYKYSGRSAISSIRWTKRHWDEYRQVVQNRDKYGLPLVRHIKAKYAKLELLSQGFIPISQFKMKTHSGKFAYIISNHLIPGETLIYPEHYAHHVKAHDKGYRYINTALSELGIDGYTRIYYTAYKNGIAK